MGFLHRKNTAATFFLPALAPNQQPSSRCSFGTKILPANGSGFPRRASRCVRACVCARACVCLPPTSLPRSHCWSVSFYLVGEFEDCHSVLWIRSHTCSSPGWRCQAAFKRQRVDLEFDNLSFLGGCSSPCRCLLGQKERKACWYLAKPV